MTRVTGIIVAIIIVVSIVRAGIFFEITLAAASRIHNLMVRHVLHAPLAFFHTNPAGRVLNRCATTAQSMTSPRAAWPTVSS